MKILTVHNCYKIRGGEDESREAEDRLLADKGHEIGQYVLQNSIIHGHNPLSVGLRATWSGSSYEAVKKRLQLDRPDLVDVHNFFPLLSPSIHYAARSLGIPVVQTLHNYRLLCPGATFYRDGKVCQECTNHLLPWPSIVHRCYHQSTLHTAAVAAMISVHRLFRTWQRAVSVFVAVSEFEKREFVKAGFPEAKIVAKPNFVFDPGCAGPGGSDFLFVGRLSPEKGIRTMLTAMENLKAPLRLRIVGEGPMAEEVRCATAKDPRIEYVGKLSQKQVLELMAQSKFVIFPSEWYETFGRVVAEAFAYGTPVITANLGGMSELVDDGRTGFHFRVGDPADLARVLEKAFHYTSGLSQMRYEARREYEKKYTPERNYEMIMELYHKAIEENTWRT